MAGNTLKTKNGTELPLMKLKGNSYLQVAHRVVWFAEENPSYETIVELPVMLPDETVAKVTITSYKEDGTLKRRVSDMKRETKGDFKDHMEKAITGAIGRCMAQLGYGTAYALADLDEGSRIVDSPVVNLKSQAESDLASLVAQNVEAVGKAAYTLGSGPVTFRKPPKSAVASTVAAEIVPSGNGWE